MASTGEARRLDRRPAHSLAGRFDPRANGIGFLRLALAVTVVVSHAWPLGGFGADPGRPGMNPGILAVDGFFALSGFLIAASAARCASVWRFLWHRALRIMPGFWCALVAIVLIFVPSTVGHLERDGWSFLASNAGLRIGQETIGKSLAGNPLTAGWTGPMYTLAIEFACYLVVATLAALRLLRPVPLVALMLLTWTALLLVLAVPGTDYRLARFPLAFLVGAVLWALADQVPASPVLAAGAAAVAIGSGWAGDYHFFALVGLPAYAYLVVWASTVLPFRRVGVRRDLSYGIYLYGWPIEQVLVAWGLSRLGLPTYLALSLTLTMGCAALSWWLVESRALRLKSRRLVGVERNAVEVSPGGATADDHGAVGVDLHGPELVRRPA